MKKIRGQTENQYIYIIQLNLELINIICDKLKKNIEDYSQFVNVFVVWVKKHQFPYFQTIIDKVSTVWYNYYYIIYY